MRIILCVHARCIQYHKITLFTQISNLNLVKLLEPNYPIYRQYMTQKRITQYHGGTEHPNCEKLDKTNILVYSTNSMAVKNQVGRNDTLETYQMRGFRRYKLLTQSSQKYKYYFHKCANMDRFTPKNTGGIQIESEELAWGRGKKVL